MGAVLGIRDLPHYPPIQRSRCGHARNSAHASSRPAVRSTQKWRSTLAELAESTSAGFVASTVVRQLTEGTSVDDRLSQAELRRFSASAAYGCSDEGHFSQSESLCSSKTGNWASIAGCFPSGPATTCFL